MGRPTTLNIRFEGKGASNKNKCYGCHLRPVSEWCSYRWWPTEGRKGYAFRMFRKIHLLPTCKKPDFDYKERDEYRSKYYEAMGIIVEEKPKGTGRGSRSKKNVVML
jgi:hypothetical protein